MKQIFINHFITVVVITTLAILGIFGLMAYFVGVELALDNMGGYYVTNPDGEVWYHAYNFLHFAAVTFLPAVFFAPLLTFVDWLNRPKKPTFPKLKKGKLTPNTITGKELADIKL